MARVSIKFFLLSLSFCLASSLSSADDAVAEAHVVLAAHTFLPAEVLVPAHKKIKLTVTNRDASSAEFESEDLSREKVVPANGEIYVYLGPLDPGSYAFYDDFHRKTASGKIVAQ